MMIGTFCLLSNYMSKQTETLKVNVSTAHLIEQLHESLKAEFGCDFAYTIMGTGHIVAASNKCHGHVKPSIKPA